MQIGETRMSKRVESWAVLDVSTGRWTRACADCAEELRPVRLAGVEAWAAWHRGKAIMLLPQHEPEQLHRGDGCDLCLSQGRHRMWAGTRWIGSPHPSERAELEPAQARAVPELSIRP